MNHITNIKGKLLSYPIVFKIINKDHYKFVIVKFFAILLLIIIVFNMLSKMFPILFLSALYNSELNNFNSVSEFQYLYC